MHVSYFYWSDNEYQNINVDIGNSKQKKFISVILNIHGVGLNVSLGDEQKSVNGI